MIRFDPARHVSKQRFDMAVARNAALRAAAHIYASQSNDDRRCAMLYRVLAAASWAILITYLATGK